MNEFLADIYNTRESIGAPRDTSDVEKLAEAQLLDEALSAEGIDIDKLPGDTILKLAHQLLGDNSALVKAAQEEAAAAVPPPAEPPAEEKKEEAAEEAAEEKAEEKEEEKKEASETFEEKVAQADFLGRVMAHSYWNEKTNIEKTAAMPAGLKKGLEAVTGKGKAMVESFRAARGGHVPGKPLAERIEGKMGRLASLKQVAKEHPKTVAGLAAAAAAPAVAVGAKKAFGKKKDEGKVHTASAIDVLAEKRAMEWAAAHGLLNTEPSDETKLASAVDQRAIEMLQEAGIDVAAVEAAAQE